MKEFTIAERLNTGITDTIGNSLFNGKGNEILLFNKRTGGAFELHFSRDGGKKFNPINVNIGFEITKLLYHSNSELLLGIKKVGAVYSLIYSDDYGINWSAGAAFLNITDGPVSLDELNGEIICCGSSVGGLEIEFTFNAADAAFTSVKTIPNFGGSIANSPNDTIQAGNFLFLTGQNSNTGYAAILRIDSNHVTSIHDVAEIGGFCDKIGYGNGLFIVSIYTLGNDFYLYRSSNAEYWTRIGLEMVERLKNILHDGKQFLILSLNPLAAFDETDGIITQDGKILQNIGIVNALGENIASSIQADDFIITTDTGLNPPDRFHVFGVRERRNEMTASGDIVTAGGFVLDDFGIPVLQTPFSMTKKGELKVTLNETVTFFDKLEPSIVSPVAAIQYRETNEGLTKLDANTVNKIFSRYLGGGIEESPVIFNANWRYLIVSILWDVPYLEPLFGTLSFNQYVNDVHKGELFSINVVNPASTTGFRVIEIGPGRAYDFLIPQKFYFNKDGNFEVFINGVI